jgi:hypothetical protein
LPASRDLQGKLIPAQLVLLSDCDGPANDHLRKLVEAAGAGIDRLFGSCPDYPHGQRTTEARLAFLSKKAQRVKASYVHKPGRSVEQIRQEAELRDALFDFAAKSQLTRLPAARARALIIEHVRSNPRLSWALEPAPGLDGRYRLHNALDALSLPLGLVAFGPVVIPAALLLLLLVRIQEGRDPMEHARPSFDHVQQLTELEDFAAHNGFTAGGLVKPGWVRRATVRSLLPLIGWGTRHLFTRDSLAGVKSIHFARWVPLDGGRRVLFASNYDGSLESYNNDFIDLVAWGLNLIFSNGLGYPQTRWLVFGGARYEQDFKDFLRRHQLPTPVWYSAYPQLTARNIERNAQLRAGLRGHMNESKAKAWLSLL